MIAALGVVVLYVGGAADPAEAAGTSGTAGFGPVYGHKYQDTSTIDAVLGSNTPKATSHIQDVSGGPVPAQYMGVLGRLFLGSSLCAQNTQYYYNDSTQHYEYDNGVYASCGPGNYNSAGVVQAYNGNGYSSNYTFVSPNQTF